MVGRRPVRKDTGDSKSKTAAGERTIPLTDVGVSALGRLRSRAETIKPVTLHTSCSPRLRLDSSAAGRRRRAQRTFPISTPLADEELAIRREERSPRKQACRFFGSMTSGNVPSLNLVKTVHPIQSSWRLPGTSAVACWNATATFGWKRNGQRWKRLLRTPKRRLRTNHDTNVQLADARPV